MLQPRPVRLGATLLALGLWVLLPPAPAAAQTFAHDSVEARRQAWLRYVHESVKKDTDRVAALARALREEAGQRKPVAPALRVRLEVLEVKALELQATVAAANEHLLSLQAVRRAEEIQSEARALRRSLAASVPGEEGKRLRRLAREMEKRADAVADRIRLP